MKIHFLIHTQLYINVPDKYFNCMFISALCEAQYIHSNRYFFIIQTIFLINLR